MRSRYPFFIAASVMVLFGALDMLRGVAAPLMQQDWQLSYFELSNIFVANSIGYLFGSFLSGFFIDRMKTRRTILTGGIGLSLSLVLTIWLQSYLGLLLAFLVAGVSSGWQEIGVNHVVPDMTADGTLQSKYFNWLHGLYGVGAFLFPSIAGLLIHMTHRWRFPYAIVLVALIIVLLLATFRWAASAQEEGFTDQSDATLETVGRSSASNTNQGKTPIFQSPLMYALILSISLYVMAEIGVGSWLTTYLVHARGLLINVSSYVLSAFYFTFTVGRLTAHLWVPRFGSERSVVVSSIAAMGLFATALLTRQTTAISLIAFALSGFGFAVIFPTIASIASYQFSHDSGRILGLLFTAAGIGSLLVNWLIGAVSTAMGIAAGLWTVVIFLGGVLAAILWVLYLTNKLGASNTAALR